MAVALLTSPASLGQKRGHLAIIIQPIERSAVASVHLFLFLLSLAPDPKTEGREKNET